MIAPPRSPPPGPIGPSISPRGAGGATVVVAAPTDAMQSFAPGQAGAAFFDPSNICNGVATADADNIVTFNMENPGTVSATPPVCAYQSVTLRGVDGVAIKADLDDLVAVMARAVDELGVDAWVWCVITAGALSATSRGYGAGLVYNAAGPRPTVLRNAGASWTVEQATASSSQRITGAVAIAGQGASVANTRVNVYGVDASDNNDPVTNTGREAAAAANVGNALDTVSFGVGWFTGAGGSAGNVRMRADVLVKKLLQFIVKPRKTWVTPPVPAGPFLDVLVTGQSNAKDLGGGADATKSGAAIPGGVTWLRDGVAVVGTWRTAADPVGWVPYLADRIVASGFTPRFVTRAAGGTTCVDQIQTYVPNAVADYLGLGRSPQLIVNWQGEAETTSPASSLPADLDENLTHQIRKCLGYWPDALFLDVKLLMQTNDYTGVGASTQWPLVITQKAAAVARFPGRVITMDPRSPTVLTLSDSVHQTPDAAGAGVAATRIWDAVKAFWGLS